MTVYKTMEPGMKYNIGDTVVLQIPPKYKEMGFKIIEGKCEIIEDECIITKTEVIA